MTAARPGTLTGTVVDSHGRAVAGVCVTATAVTEPDAGSRTVVTSAAGLFMITDLRAGRYLLRYRDCLARPGQIGGSRAAVLGPGPLVAPVAATSGFVTGGHVSVLGRVTLRSARAGRVAALPVRPATRRFTSSQLRHRFSGQRFGGIAGRVLGPHGRPVKGLCFFINFRGALSAARSGRTAGTAWGSHCRQAPTPSISPRSARPRSWLPRLTGRRSGTATTCVRRRPIRSWLRRARSPGASAESCSRAE